MQRNAIITTSKEALRWKTLQGEIDGARIIKENTNAYGIYLFQVYRVAVLWVLAQPGRSAGGELLDSKGTESIVRNMMSEMRFGFDNPCAGLCLIVTELLADIPNRRQIALAAMTVVEWCLSKRYLESAFAYARLAAAAGDTARYAWIIGRLHREYGRIGDAETWFRVAYSLSNKEGDADVKARALMSWGRLDQDVGRYHTARERFTAALLVAKRKKLPGREAEVHHDLFLVAIGLHDTAAAARESAATLAGYGPGHPRLPHFAHDLALYWTELGDYSSALDVLLNLFNTQFKNEPVSRLLVSATAMRAAGGAGKAGTFDLLLEQFNRLRDSATGSSYLAQALVAAARGAGALRRWDLASGLLTDAGVEARKTGQNDIEVICDGLLAKMKQEELQERVVLTSIPHTELAAAAIRLLQGTPAPALAGAGTGASRED